MKLVQQLAPMNYNLKCILYSLDPLIVLHPHKGERQRKAVALLENPFMVQFILV